MSILFASILMLGSTSAAASQLPTPCVSGVTDQCTRALQHEPRFSGSGFGSNPPPPPYPPPPLNYSLFDTEAALLDQSRLEVTNYAKAIAGDGSVRSFCSLGEEYPGTAKPNVQQDHWSPPLTLDQFGLLPQGTARDYTFSYFDTLTAAPTPPCQELHNETMTENAQAPLYCPSGFSGPYNDSNIGPYCYRIKCKTCKLHGVGSSAGDPVNFLEKINFQTEVDYSADGLLRVELRYRSDGFMSSPGAGTSVSSFGSVWRGSYERRLTTAIGTNSAEVVELDRPDGEQFFFTYFGYYYGRSDAPGTLKRVLNGQGTVIGWTYESTDNEIETYDINGLLTRIDRRDGRYVTLTHDASGYLLTATDEHGRMLTFNYDLGDGYPGQAHVANVTLPDGNTVSYDYKYRAVIAAVHFPDGTTRQYAYNDPNSVLLLTSVTDENGATYASFTYDSSHFPLTTQLAGGVYKFTAVSGQTAYTDPLGTTHTFTVQNVAYANRVTAETKTCTGCTTTTKSVHYDNIGNVDYAFDYNGNRTNYTYDPHYFFETSRIEAVGKPAQRTTNTTWNANMRVPDQRTVLNASGVTEAMTKWAYNSRGQTTARCSIDPAISGAPDYICGSQANAPIGVRQWTYAYCDAVGAGCPIVGLLVSVDGPRTNASDITSYAYYQTTDPYHSAGDLQYVTNAVGHVTTYVSYDKNGRVTRMQDANGTFTDMTYHARGWLLTRTVRANADGTTNPSLDATTTFTYDSVGNITQVTQPDGTYLHYVYDNAHRLTDIYDSATPSNYLLGDHIQYTLDAAGNRKQEDTKDPNGTLKRTLARQYDQLNRLTHLQNTTPDDVQKYINPLDAPPAGITYIDGYDGNGNAIYSVDGNGVGTEQLYDPLNRLVKILQDHAGSGATRDTATQYAYDARDNLRSVIDPDNLSTSYTYDGLNNLTALGSPDTGSTGYTYDSAGNRATQTDARGVTSTYDYDALNRLVDITYPTASLNITYSYDEPSDGCYNVGRLTTMIDSSGSTTYCYDRHGNVLQKMQITNGIALPTTYEYSVSDRLTSVTYPSGSYVTYTRDNIGRVTGVEYFQYSGGWRWGNWAEIPIVDNVSYYPFGPVNVITFDNGRTLTKTYDQNYAIDKVVSSDPSGLIIDATADVLGNLNSASSSLGASPATLAYSYDPLYRLTGVTDASSNTLQGFTYDKTGDRLSKSQTGQTTQTYAYSSPLTSHRLQSVAGVSRSYDANGNYTDAGAYTFDDRNRLSLAAGTPYVYNGNGERVSKGGSSTQTNFVYSEGGQLLGEYDANGALLSEYVYLDGTPVGVATGGNVYYIETDQLGTPREVVDSDNTVVWKWDYFASNGAFGENIPSVQTITFNLRFPGQYFDAETGLNYNYFRDYEPGTGRYVESDPVGLRGGMSTYGYVGQRPTRFSDPKGLLAFNSCSWEQLQQLMDAELELEKKLGGDCTQCDAESDCIPCRYKHALLDRLHHSIVSCSDTEDYTTQIFPLRFPNGACARGDTPGHGITMFPLGFTDSCACVTGTLLHELLHNVGVDSLYVPGNPTGESPDHPEIDFLSMGCVSCYRMHHYSNGPFSPPSNYWH